MMLTFTLNDNTIMICLHYSILNNVLTGKSLMQCVYVDIHVCMCVRSRESAFSWCLKKSSMKHYDLFGSLLDAVSLSVNDRVDSNLKHHSIRCKSKVHFDTIVLKLNSSNTSICCYNVRSTLLLPMTLKRSV